MLPLRATGLGCTFSVACRHYAVVISGTQSVIKAWDGSLRGKRASAEKSKRNTFVLHWPGKFFVRTWPGHIGFCLICTKIKRFNGGLSLALFLGRIRGFQWILCHHCYTSRKYNSGDRCFCCLWKAMVPSLCLATLLTVVHRLHGFMYVMCCMCTN